MEKNSSDPQVLIIEDEQDIASLICLHLQQLPAEISIATDGKSGLALALAQKWDAVILDLGLPGMNGLDLCRSLRSSCRHIPILILSARDSELDRVLGLELGADDYLTKPFSVLELQARIKALLRRSQIQGDVDVPDHIQAGELGLSRLQRRAWLAGCELTLTAREFDLLWFFAQNPGRAFSRSELLKHVWGYGHDGYEHTVNSHINRLRAKLEKQQGAEQFIHTVWGIGYRFEAAK
ncbi:response regulator transcription factor [Iodobacter violaceini]|uniref:response regulator transcription factor n=1 Tax=Iodobacter violaceini TaxID=3044271 RepID=UPI00197C35DC|nr:response regulator transcription factor [Iodobacter violacea]